MTLNEKNESKKVVLGVIFGSVAVATAFYFLNGTYHRKTPILHKIGKTISEVGEMLENTNIKKSCSEAMESLEKKLPKSTEIVSQVASWIGSGMDLWKQLKKGW